ncbi:MAG: fluoride efflux transporter CrcB [Candidatus Eisenbacteria bacterium]|nr:fluoride efflux transporter CrcB [Candidatus Eisenbacteria bacterium]
MRSALLVALGGALGSVLRWLVGGWVQSLTPSSTFPWGTFAVNAIGSFAIGALLGLALERALVPPAMRLLLVTGLLGGFTTFSSFSYETLQLARDGQWPAAVGYSLGSLVLGVAAAFVGWALVTRV